MPSVTVAQVTADELYLLNRFYRRNGHKGKANQHDSAFWLRDAKTIVAALRLTPCEYGNLLRGMWVDKAHRGQHLGADLLKGTKDYWGKKRCYCFPYSHLQPFYEISGFILSNHHAPKPLQDQLSRYLHRGEDVVLMEYHPP